MITDTAEMKLLRFIYKTELSFFEPEKKNVRRMYSNHNTVQLANTNSMVMNAGEAFVLPPDFYLQGNIKTVQYYPW